MRLNKIIVSITLSMLLSIGVFANEPISMNFKDLQIKEFAKIVAKILDKNILFTTPLKGKVDFESNNQIYTDDLLRILMFSLESKGYTVIDNNSILRIVRLSDVAKYNTPIYNNSSNISSGFMATEVFNIVNLNVDYISSKIRHLLSKAAKLVTDKESNAIILTDFPSNIRTVKKIISILSKDSAKTIKTIKLKNVQGNSVVSDLNNVAKTVFNTKIEKEKVSVLFNKDTNSIIFVGKEKNVNFLAKYLANIDEQGSLVEKVVEVIYLKNAESKNVIKILTGIISKKIYKDKNDKPFASTDEESNSIILMGPKEELKYFTLLIKKLDIDRPQVYVKARIIEVNEGKADNIGIKYGLSGGELGNNGLFSFAAKMGGASIINEVSKIVEEPNDLKRGLALGATINLLKNNQAIDIVSEPSLLCINNKESSIYVGETKSFQTGTTVGTTSSVNYKREDVGLTLKVKPRISTGGKVTLEISVVVEDAKELQAGQTNPDTSKKDIKTTAIVNNGEAVILGGYVKNTVDTIEEKVPFFGDIPILGALFRNNKSVKNRINLVIIITPYIVQSSSDLTNLRTQLSELNVLEEKYTKDLTIKLEERKLKIQQDTVNRKMAVASIKAERIEYIEDNAEILGVVPKKTEIQKTNKEKHQKILKDVFGI